MMALLIATQFYMSLVASCVFESTSAEYKSCPRNRGGALDEKE